MGAQEPGVLPERPPPLVALGRCSSRTSQRAAVVIYLKNAKDVVVAKSVVEAFQRSPYAAEGLIQSLAPLGAAFLHEPLDSLAHVRRFKQILRRGLSFPGSLSRCSAAIRAAGWTRDAYSCPVGWRALRRSL